MTRRETLFLTLNAGNQMWALRDSSGHHIGFFQTRADAEKFATENEYRLQVASGNRVEWFN